MKTDALGIDPTDGRLNHVLPVRDTTGLGLGRLGLSPGWVRSAPHFGTSETAKRASGSFAR